MSVILVYGPSLLLLRFLCMSRSSWCYWYAANVRHVYRSLAATNSIVHSQTTVQVPQVYRPNYRTLFGPSVHLAVRSRV